MTTSTSSHVTRLQSRPQAKQYVEFSERTALHVGHFMAGLTRKLGLALHAAGGWYPNHSSSAEDGRCDASKKRSHNHGECDPENQLWEKSNLYIRRPEAHRSESRRQCVIVGTPTSPDGKKHQDRHGNSRRVPVRQQRLRQSRPSPELQRTRDHHE